MKQSGFERATSAKNKQCKKSAAYRDTNRRKVYQILRRRPFSSKVKACNKPRTVQFEWIVNKKIVKIDQLQIDEISQFTKIVAQQVTNMQEYQNSGGTIELQISIKSEETEDFAWAINSWRRFNELRDDLLSNRITMAQIYLILQEANLDSVIPVFEKNADG